MRTTILTGNFCNWEAKNKMSDCTAKGQLDQAQAGQSLRLRGSFQPGREICRAENAEFGLASVSGEGPITMMQWQFTPL